MPRNAAASMKYAPNAANITQLSNIKAKLTSVHYVKENIRHIKKIAPTKLAHGKS